MKTTRRAISTQEREALLARLVPVAHAGLWFFIKFFSILVIAAALAYTAIHFISNWYLLAPVLLLIAGVFGLLALIAFLQRINAISELSELKWSIVPALKQGEVEVWEFTVRRGWRAPSLDKQIPGALLDTADGWCIYINADTGGWLDQTAGTARSVWRFLRSPHNSYVMGIESDPPAIALAPTPPEFNPRAFLSAVHDCHGATAIPMKVGNLPAEWQKLLHG